MAPVTSPNTALLRTPTKQAQNRASLSDPQLHSALSVAFPAYSSLAITRALGELLIHPNRYVLIGSASVHLQAAKLMRDQASLPKANDIDIVLLSSFIAPSLNNENSESNDFRIKKIDSYTYELHELGVKEPLKIDLIEPSSSNPVFRKYPVDFESAMGVNIAKLGDVERDHNSRLSDPDAKVKMLPGTDQVDRRSFREKWPVFGAQDFEEVASLKRSAETDDDSSIDYASIHRPSKKTSLLFD